MPFVQMRAAHKKDGLESKVMNGFFTFLQESFRAQTEDKIFGRRVTGKNFCAAVSRVRRFLPLVLLINYAGVPFFVTRVCGGVKTEAVVIIKVFRGRRGGVFNYFRVSSAVIKKFSRQSDAEILR